MTHKPAHTNPAQSVSRWVGQRALALAMAVCVLGAQTLAPLHSTVHLQNDAALQGARHHNHSHNHHHEPGHGHGHSHDDHAHPYSHLNSHVLPSLAFDHAAGDAQCYAYDALIGAAPLPSCALTVPALQAVALTAAQPQTLPQHASRVWLNPPARAPPAAA